MWFGHFISCYLIWFHDLASCKGAYERSEMNLRLEQIGKQTVPQRTPHDLSQGLLGIAADQI